jgi:hypothetical protein
VFLPEVGDHVFNSGTLYNPEIFVTVLIKLLGNEGRLRISVHKSNFFETVYASLKVLFANLYFLQENSIAHTQLKVMIAKIKVGVVNVHCRHMLQVAY